MPIKGENRLSFYYQIPPRKSLKRLLNDNSLRPFIIHRPTFAKRADVRMTFKFLSQDKENTQTEQKDCCGNKGCKVFKQGVQNYKDFCLIINILKENY